MLVSKRRERPVDFEGEVADSRIPVHSEVRTREKVLVGEVAGQPNRKRWSGLSSSRSSCSNDFTNETL